MGRGGRRRGSEFYNETQREKENYNQKEHLCGFSLICASWIFLISLIHFKRPEPGKIYNSMMSICITLFRPWAKGKLGISEKEAMIIFLSRRLIHSWRCFITRTSIGFRSHSIPQSHNTMEETYITTTFIFKSYCIQYLTTANFFKQP